MLSTVELAGWPTRMLPSNWAGPVSDRAVASGKFHSRFSRRPSLGNEPMNVATLRVLPYTLTRTVAPSGIPLKTNPVLPPVSDSRSASTSKIWIAEVPSPVNVMRSPTCSQVPVASRCSSPS
ncbi:hypothetical protein SSPNP10_02355 [Streptomyces sp. NP10]|nr:hypothetical protein SSPNP10_02355 [Streptomyces sp. NP10]